MSTKVKRGTFRRSCRTCGWSGEYATAARGDYAKRRHTCSKHLAKTERAARHEQRMQSIDRTPKPCHHKQTTHQHGTYACYILDKCRCTPCCEAQYAWYDENNRAKAYGRWDNLVPAAHARAHVLHLMSQGMGIKRIVKVSGISQGVMWKLLYGKTSGDGSRTPSKRIRKQTAETLLAVELDLADGAVIDSTGTRRRLQALVAIGYSQSKLAAHLDIEPGNFSAVIHTNRGTTVGRARQVRALYDELAMSPYVGDSWHEKSSASRARNLAAAHGWPPPLAWDDESIDDPQAKPMQITDVEEDDPEAPVVDEAAIWRSINGDRTVTLTSHERREVIRVLHARGLSDRQISELTGFKSVVKERQRLGLKPNAARIDWSEYGERRTRATA